MTTPTLADLVTTQTTDQMLTSALALAQANGLPTTAWQPATVPRTLMGIDAKALADMTGTVASIANGGFLSTATGDWLTLLAHELYNIDRNDPVATIVVVTLTAAAAAGPYTIAVGDLWVTTADGRRYNNTTGGNLAPGGTLDLLFQAEAAGSTYNTPTVNKLVTTLAGVTVANAVNQTGFVTGTDAETDAALVVRCQDKWATLAGTAAPSAAYDYWAKAADTTVTKTKITQDGAGNVTIYVGGSAGGVDPAAVNAYIADLHPLTDNPTAVAATNKTVVVTGTVYVAAAQLTAAQMAAAANANILNAANPIGGAALDNAGAKGLSAALVEKAITDPTGVLNAKNLMFNVNGGGAVAAADVNLAANEVAVLDISGLTWTGV